MHQIEIYLDAVSAKRRTKLLNAFFCYCHLSFKLSFFSLLTSCSHFLPSFFISLSNTFYLSWFNVFFYLSLLSCLFCLPKSLSFLPHHIFGVILISPYDFFSKIIFLAGMFFYYFFSHNMSFGQLMIIKQDLDLPFPRYQFQFQFLVFLLDHISICFIS